MRDIGDWWRDFRSKKAQRNPAFHAKVRQAADLKESARLERVRVEFEADRQKKLAKNRIRLSAVSESAVVLS